MEQHRHQRRIIRPSAGDEFKSLAVAALFIGLLIFVLCYWVLFPAPSPLPDLDKNRQPQATDFPKFPK